MGNGVTTQFAHIWSEPIERGKTELGNEKKKENISRFWMIVRIPDVTESKR